MFRYLQCLVIALLFLLPNLTQAGDIYEDVSQDDLWDIVEAKDFAAAEALFAKSHAFSLEDADAIDHTRWLFETFGTNNPKVAQFAERWLDAYPQSAYANTANAWVLYNTGWHIRGEGAARDLFPDATAIFAHMHRDAWEHAKRAYDAAPDLLPASDAMFWLTNSTHNRTRALEVLHLVMNNAPNLGTLTRALDMTNPGWGGSWELAKKICAQYAPLVEIENSKNNVRWCEIFAAGNFHMYNRSEWFIQEASKREFRDLDYLYARYLSTKNASRRDAAFLHEYLTNPDVTDYKVAYRFDSDIAQKYGYGFLYEDHIRRAKETALAEIERDPYDPDKLETLLKDISGFSIRDDGGIRISVIERTPEEKKAEYARRMLEASPFDDELWRAYARYRFSARHADHILLDEPYLINAIVYSNHDSYGLQAFANSRFWLLSELERLEWEMERPEFEALSPDRRAEVTKIIESWIERRETLDLDTKIRCPMMRAYRLYQMLCGRPGQGACEIDPKMKDMYEIVKSDVNERRVCTGVMSASEYDLYFTPIPVDFDAAVPEITSH
ncbi:hypothetical protein [Roseovarius phycicola]|uniref:DUF4034 domain-containing protein n=1 Tax=Roseovarius phycicola TaxID=3080976 RepID=A0ABZ2HN32_9RHOB